MTRETEHARERDDSKERSAPRGAVVYESIAHEGENELARRSDRLGWSGLAAGLTMGFSFLGQSLLQHHLPDTDWRPLISKFGYSFGFLIVILGRQQLFTENTLTVILPFLDRKRLSVLSSIGRLWAVVLLANLAGAFLVALVLAKTGVVEPSMHATLSEVGRATIKHDVLSMFVRAIFAGWLIALMVWLLPFAESFRVVVIILIAYLIGIAEFPHIIAGAVDVLYLVVRGELAFGTFITRFFTPTLLGNIIGGVTLVALLGHMQFASERPGAEP